MGYDVHVTRARQWFESTDSPISLEEWLAFVESDPEVRLDGFAEAATDDGTVVRVESPGLAVWTAWSQHRRGGNMAWMDYRDGRVVVKNPDAEIRGKLFKIAGSLRANVQGDDGETYGPGGQPTPPVPTRPRSWWRRLLGGSS